MTTVKYHYEVPRYNDDDRAQMVELYLRYGYDEAARRIGCSPNTVFAAVRTAGVQPRRKGTRLRTRYGKWWRRKEKTGYIAWYAWDSELGRNVRLMEHRMFMVWKLGRELVEGENVHHRDGNKTNNHPDNLELWVTAQPSGMSHCPHCRLPLNGVPAFAST